MNKRNNKLHYQSIEDGIIISRLGIEQNVVYNLFSEVQILIAFSAVRRKIKELIVLQWPVRCYVKKIYYTKLTVYGRNVIIIIRNKFKRTTNSSTLQIVSKILKSK